MRRVCEFLRFLCFCARITVSLCTFLHRLAPHASRCCSRCYYHCPTLLLLLALLVLTLLVLAPLTLRLLPWLLPLLSPL